MEGMKSLKNLYTKIIIRSKIFSVKYIPNVALLTTSNKYIVLFEKKFLHNKKCVSSLTAQNTPTVVIVPIPE